jgi:hypothetical protein
MGTSLEHTSPHDSKPCEREEEDIFFSGKKALIKLKVAIKCISLSAHCTA